MVMITTVIAVAEGLMIATKEPAPIWFRRRRADKHFSGAKGLKYLQSRSARHEAVVMTLGRLSTKTPPNGCLMISTSFLSI